MEQATTYQMPCRPRQREGLRYCNNVLVTDLTVAGMIVMQEKQVTQQQKPYPNTPKFFSHPQALLTFGFFLIRPLPKILTAWEGAAGSDDGVSSLSDLRFFLTSVAER